MRLWPVAARLRNHPQALYNRLFPLLDSLPHIPMDKYNDIYYLWDNVWRQGGNEHRQYHLILDILRVLLFIRRQEIGVAP